MPNYARSYYFLGFFTIVFFLITLLTPFRILIFSKAAYQAFQKQSGVYETVSEKESNTYLDNLFDYFRGNNILDTNLYSSQAARHLGDVKGLIENAFKLLYTTIIILTLISVIFIVKRQTIRLLIALRKAGAAVVVFWIILLPLVLIAFGPLFILFHKIFFNNNLWLFPAEDSLIGLFPEKFFMLFGGFIAACSMTMSFAVYFLITIIQRNVRRVI